MSTTACVTLILQGVIFAAWAALMFRTLFRLNTIAERPRRALGQSPLPFRQTIATFADFAKGRTLRPDRNRLIWLTLLLFASIALGEAAR